MRYNPNFKTFFLIFDIVNDTPFIKIEAFSIKSFLYFLDILNSKLKIYQFFKIFTNFYSTVSTCP